MEKLEIETTEDKLLDDLNMEKGLEIEEIRKMEIKLKKLKLPKEIKIKKLLLQKILGKYLYHISRQKIL